MNPGIVLPSPVRPEKGLGRLPARPDIRDFDHPMRPMLRQARPLPTYRFWPIVPIRQVEAPLHQNGYPRCVAFAWSHWAMAAPVRQRLPMTEAELYIHAQRVDEWEGEGYDGTSVRAGAKVLAEARVIEEYLWAMSVQDIRGWVLGRGPVVFGTSWYEGMDRPDDRGFIRPEGALVGGHAYVLIGYHPRDGGLFRVLNSWGPRWGDRGRAWMTQAHVEMLLADYGEACSAIQRKV